MEPVAEAAEIAMADVEGRARRGVDTKVEGSAVLGTEERGGPTKLAGVDTGTDVNADGASDGSTVDTGLGVGTFRAPWFEGATVDLDACEK